MTDKITGPASESQAVEENKVSRRALLRGTSFVAGGAALLMGMALPAQAKMPQKASGYQDTPKGAAKCSNCMHFQAPAACAIVAGKISPEGWCRFYAKK
jgi:hypothetical protein